jgi:hypothetical protein
VATGQVRPYSPERLEPWTRVAVLRSWQQQQQQQRQRQHSWRNVLRTRHTAQPRSARSAMSRQHSLRHALRRNLRCSTASSPPGSRSDHWLSRLLPARPNRNSLDPAAHHCSSVHLITTLPASVATNNTTSKCC